jgi:tetratricopeptide (TPR) repeat protein
MVSMSFAKKWDATYISKLIAGGGIDKVIEYYKGRYYGDNRDPQDAFKIAELYVKKKEYATAMEWYDKESQLINTSKVNLFNYANTNRLMGEYQKALDGYLI